MTTFAGVWNVTIDTLMGKMEVTLDITEQDGAIRGVASNGKETVDFLEPVANGNQLTWSQAVTTPMKLMLRFDVTVDGDTMTGTSKAGIFAASKLHGSRVPTS